MSGWRKRKATGRPSLVAQPSCFWKLSSSNIKASTREVHQQLLKLCSDDQRWRRRPHDSPCGSVLAEEGCNPPYEHTRLAWLIQPPSQPTSDLLTLYARKLPQIPEDALPV